MNKVVILVAGVVITIVLVVILATGLGKDAPGSPVTARARFPDQGIVWELNYRGELIFLEQAVTVLVATTAYDPAVVCGPKLSEPATPVKIVDGLPFTNNW